MRPTKPFVLLAIAFAGLLLVALTPLPQGPFVTYARGQVTVDYGDGTKADLSAGEGILPGAAIATGADGACELALIEGAWLRLGPSTQLQYLGPQSAAGKESWKVKSGILFVKAEGCSPALLIKTARGVSELVSARAELSTADQIGTVRCYEGSVVFRLPGGGLLGGLLGPSEVTVGAGQTSQTVEKLPPTQPKAFSIPSTEPWFSDESYFQGAVPLAPPWLGDGTTDTGGGVTDTGGATGGWADTSAATGASEVPSNLILNDIPPGGPLLGTWWQGQTNKLTLTQHGDRITGVYTQNKGQIEGTLVGDLLSGTWRQAPSYQEPNDTGQFELRLSADGQWLKGRWRKGSGGAWNNNWAFQMQYTEVDWRLLPTLRPPSTDQAKLVADLGMPNTFTIVFDEEQQVWCEVYGYYYTGAGGKVMGRFQPRQFYFRNGVFTGALEMDPLESDVATHPLLLEPWKLNQNWSPAMAERIFGPPKVTYTRSSPMLGELVYLLFDDCLILGFKDGKLVSAEKSLAEGEIIR